MTDRFTVKKPSLEQNSGRPSVWRQVFNFVWTLLKKVSIFPKNARFYLRKRAEFGWYSSNENSNNTNILHEFQTLCPQGSCTNCNDSIINCLLTLVKFNYWKSHFQTDMPLSLSWLILKPASNCRKKFSSMVFFSFIEQALDVGQPYNYLLKLLSTIWRRGWSWVLGCRMIIIICNLCSCRSQECGKIYAHNVRLLLMKLEKPLSTEKLWEKTPQLVEMLKFPFIVVVPRKWWLKWVVQLWESIVQSIEFTLASGHFFSDEGCTPVMISRLHF